MVSVIIPTYNSSDFVSKAIDSVLDQSYDDYEIIVVDDGSTDNTREILEKYKGIIKYVYQDNGGPAKARNTGIKMAKGSYIAFLDSDDLWLPDKLKKQFDFFNENPQYHLVYTDMAHAINGEIIYKSYLKERNYKHISSGYIYENLLRECFIFTPTVMMKKECIDNIGFFNEKLRISEDHDLWLRIADKYQIGFLDEALTIRNRHESNLTSDRYLYISSGIKMMEGIYDKNKGNKVRRKIIDEELGNRYFLLGYYFFDLGQYNKARSSLLKSLRHHYSFKIILYLATSCLPSFCVSAIRKFKRSTEKSLHWWS